MRRGTRRSWIERAVVLAIAWPASSCSPRDFTSEALVNNVRILASSADEPYAAPGDVVHVTVLAYDGRTASARTGPMLVSWLPVTPKGQVVACDDPPNDAYFGCFGGVAKAIAEGATIGAGIGDDAGVGMGAEAGTNDDDAGAPGEEAGTEMDAAAMASPSIPAAVIATGAFTMPLDVVTAHPLVAGTTPYGLAILFNAACAGRVAFAATASANPQQPPIACLDDAGNALGPDDYVIGYTRVYSRLTPDGGYYANANPVIVGVDGPPCGTVQGSVPTFTALPLAALCTSEACPNVKLGAIVPTSSWEVNPLDTDPSGNPRHEEIWVDYYATFGGFTSETRLLYDPVAGAVNGADTAFQPPLLGPNDVHDGMIFGVVHDDRGGASWVTIPTHVCSDPSDPACGASAPSACPDASVP